MAKFSGYNHSSSGVPDLLYGKANTSGLNRLNGVFIAKVIEMADDGYQQHIWVDLVGSEVSRDKSTQKERKKYHKIRQMSPFGGTVQSGKGSNNYGAIWTPPAPGTEVLVAFTGSDQEGFLLGVLPDINRNAMLGGHPASPDPETGEVKTAYDHHVKKQHDETRQKHPTGEAIDQQGLFADSLRGHASSGGRRESPTNVSGFNTPGGHSLVLDDGTVSYKEGVNYVPDKNREEGKNKLLRLRSSNGAQIVMNDTANMIYIINQTGTAWVEMDADGNVDVFSNKNISMHAADTINFYAGAEFNVDAEDINIRARGSNGIKLEATTDQIQLFAQEDLKLTSKRNMHLRAGPHMRLTADLIDLNGPPAVEATKPTVGALSVNNFVKESITNRVPEAEPWRGHSAQDSKIAAQAKSHPLDPDVNDYNLATTGIGSGGSSRGRASNNPKRRAQISNNSDMQASIYPDSIIDQQFNRNSIARNNQDTYNIGTEGEFAGVRNPEDNYRIGNDGEFAGTPTTTTVVDAGAKPTVSSANPRTKRKWDSDVGWDV